MSVFCPLSAHDRNYLAAKCSQTSSDGRGVVPYFILTAEREKRYLK